MKKLFAHTEKASKKTKLMSVFLMFAILITAFVPSMTAFAATSSNRSQVTVIRITNSSVRVRSGPSTSATALAVYNTDAKFKYVSSVTGESVYSGNSTWYKVQYGTGTTDGASGYGYIYSGYSVMQQHNSIASASVTGTGVNVRRGPGTSFASFTMTTTGNTYTVFYSTTRQGVTWYLVGIGNRVGYISGAYLNVT